MFQYIPSNESNSRSRSNSKSKSKSPSKTPSKNDCPVCLNPIEPKDKVKFSGCTHKFHTECLNKWFKAAQKKTCPICRAEYQENSNTRQDFNPKLKNLKSATFSDNNNIITAHAGGKIQIWPSMTSISSSSDPEPLFTNTLQLHPRPSDMDNFHYIEGALTGSSSRTKPLILIFTDQLNLYKHNVKYNETEIIASLDHGHYISKLSLSPNRKIVSICNDSSTGKLVWLDAKKDPNKIQYENMDYIKGIVFLSNSLFVVYGRLSNAMKRTKQFLLMSNRKNKLEMKNELDSTAIQGTVACVEVLVPKNKPASLVCATQKGDIYVMKIEHYQMALDYKIEKAHEDIIYDIAVHPDQRHFASGSFDNYLRLWKNGSSEPVHLENNYMEKKNVMTVFFNKTGSQMSCVRNLYHGITVWSTGIKSREMSKTRSKSKRSLSRSTVKNR